MRVAIFSDTYVPQINGVSLTLKRATDYLDKQQIPFRLFAPAYGEPVEPRDTRVYRMPSIPFPVYPECRLAWARAEHVDELMQCFAPHLVHLVTPFSIGLAGLRWALQNDIPILASFHTNFVEYLAYYHASFLGGPVWRFFRWFHDHADLNLAPSQSTKQKLAENGIAPVRLWGRGVNTREFSPSHRNGELREQLGAEDKTLLLYVGRLAPEKDLDILWQALRRLNQDEYPVQLVVTGKGPLENQLRDTAPDNVTFTGYLQGEDLHRVYASCDIFAFPSTTETYGNVVLEAHASGLPVVAPLSGGIRENLVDGVNGLACTPRDAEEMADRLTTLLARPRLRKRLGTNGRKHALGKSWDNIMAGLVNDYCAVAFGDSQQDREVDYVDDAGEIAVGSGRD